MGCNQALADAINNVASALRVSGGAGSNCYGSVVNCFGQYTDDQFLDTPPDAVDPHGEEPPPGFDTMEEYLIYKCQAAYIVLNWLVGFARGISGWSALQLVLATAGPLVAVLLGGLGAAIAFPPAAVVALVAAVLVVGGLSVGGFYAGVLLADYLTSHSQEIVCALYESGSAGDALQAIAGFIEDAFQSVEFAAFLEGMPGGMEGALGTLFGSVQTNSLVAPLFQLTADVVFPGADCSECEEQPPEENVFSFTEGAQGFVWTDLSSSPSEAAGEWQEAPEFSDPSDESAACLHSTFDRDNADCYGIWECELDPSIHVETGDQLNMHLRSISQTTQVWAEVVYTDDENSQDPTWAGPIPTGEWIEHSVALIPNKDIRLIQIRLAAGANGQAETLLDHVGVYNPNP